MCDDDEVGVGSVAAAREKTECPEITLDDGDEDQDARGGVQGLVAGCHGPESLVASGGKQQKLKTGKAFSNTLVKFFTVVNPGTDKGSLGHRDCPLRPGSTTTTQDQASSQHLDSKEDIPASLPEVGNTTGQGGARSKVPTTAQRGVRPATGQSEPGQVQTEPGQAQKHNTVQVLSSAVGGVKVEEGRCQHTRGGYCRLHGAGARKYFRPVRRTTVGPGGEMISKTTKKTYYECDLGQRGRGGLRQSQLSFTARRTADRAGLGGEDTRGGRRDDISNDSHDFSSTNAGQGTSSCTSKEEDVVDEN